MRGLLKGSFPSLVLLFKERTREYVLSKEHSQCGSPVPMWVTCANVGHLCQCCSSLLTSLVPMHLSCMQSAPEQAGIRAGAPVASKGGKELSRIILDKNHSDELASVSVVLCSHWHMECQANGDLGSCISQRQN